MKLIPQINYDDKDYEDIKDLKEKLGSNWHDFILDLVRDYNKNLKGGE